MQIWLKSDKNTRHFTRIPKYVLMLPATLKRHKSALFELKWYQAVRMAVEV